MCLSEYHARQRQTMENLSLYLASTPLKAGHHLPPDAEIRGAVAAALRRFRGHRDEIAAQMSRLTCQPIKAHMLNAYASPGKQAVRFPAAFVAAFCTAT